MAISTIGQEGLSSSAQYTGFKNRIINGDMRIDQYTAGSGKSISAAVAGFGLDRFSTSCIGATVATIQQSTIAPSGFKNSFSLTITTPDTSVTGTDAVTIWQRIEGNNLYDMGFGSSSASPFTLSFWVRASVTGTYCVRFSNAGYDRSYVAPYTINSVNTWEYKTITIPGDTTGTWLTSNNMGLVVEFCVGNGTTYQTSTANTWLAGNYVSTAAQTNLISTTGATFYITGVQLEKGSVATAFDYRPYGTELQLCQRYCYALDNRSGQSYYAYGIGTWVSTAACQCFVKFPVNMRVPPTALTSGSVSGQFFVDPGITNFTTITLDQIGNTGGYFLLSGGSGGYAAGSSGRVLSNNTASSNYIIFNAEL